MKTYTLKAGDLDPKWVMLDADGQVLGRLASQVAQILRGKHKPNFVPHLDNGDFVVIVNAEKIRLTGKKAEAKSYFRHTGYPGGVKFTSFREMIEKHPDRVIQKAVKGMLPHNSLGAKMLKKLKVYSGTDHPHKAQQPESIKL
ncbi:MAG: 50S ribosomal protein L13 [Candidatus Marinimicrobia bacterium]|nr:50S ribosomal protein L13 [Candidatus Neomarinimicrobiota bacterium]